MKIVNITILFWITLICIDNPGNIYSLLSINSSTAMKFTKYIILFVCFYFLFSISKDLIIDKSRIYLMVKKFIILWLFYYIIVYAIYNSNYNLNLLDFFAKHHKMIIGILIFFPVCSFASLDLLPFIRAQSFISILVCLLFIITVLTGIKIFDVLEFSRHYTDANRLIFKTGKIIYFSLPLGIAAFLLKMKNNKFTNLLLVASILIISIILLSITRRWILAIIIHMFIISLLINYINNQGVLNSFRFFKNKKIILLSSVLFISFVVIKPQYIKATSDSIVNVYQNITGEIIHQSSAQERLSLTKKVSMVSTIKDNLFFGTGYDPRWFSNIKSDKSNKWEGSDYIFLGAFGQFGIIGLLLFSPFYIFSLLVIKTGMKIIKSNKDIIYQNSNMFYFSIITFIACSSEIIKNLIEYPNWFAPIGASSSGYLFFIILGLLIGSYISINNNLKILNKSIINE